MQNTIGQASRKVISNGEDMIVKQIKLSEKDKERLSRLKGKTGISNWNVLCRWALCYSLSEPSVPFDQNYVADSNVEMSWSTFGGEYEELYELLIRERCLMDGLGTKPETLVKYFKLHLTRGIANVIRSIDDLMKLAQMQAAHLQLDSAKGSDK